jgi:signal transduction histidine kinase
VAPRVKKGGASLPGSLASAPDRDRQRSARHPRFRLAPGNLLAIALLVAVYSALLWFLLPQKHAAIFQQFAGIESAALGAALLLRLGSERLAAVTFVAASWVVIIVTLLPVGGLEGSGYLGAAVLIVFAGLALGIWEAVAVAAATLAAGAAMAVVLGGSPAVSSMTPSAAAAAWAAAATSYALILVLVRVAVSDISGAVGSLRGELARRQATEVALRASESRLGESLSLLRATLDSTADGILAVDSEGRVVGHNQKFLDLWRIPSELARAENDEKLLGYVLGQLRDPDEFIAKVRHLYGDSEAVSFDVLEFVDGRVVERYSQPQKIEGRTVGRVWSFRDVTERRRNELARHRLEEELFRSQRLEALGRLAGGIAHDFNNILTAIMSYTELALLDVADRPEVAESLGAVLTASQRARNLVTQVLAFSRTRANERIPLSLKVPVAEAVRLLKSTLPGTIQVAMETAGDDLVVLADPAQIHQVVTNLGVNAGHAMEESGGRLVVRLQSAIVADFDQMPVPGLTAGPHMVLTVSDTGPGMDPTVLDRIFEPFFSTKSPGKGTGLGLSVVHSMVRNHGGGIAVDSTPGSGTTFNVYLPAHRGIDESAPPPAGSGAAGQTR